MARYKVLRGVVHNIGQSFTGLMNYRGDDYVMVHILRLARRTGRDTLTIDFIKAEAGPVELLAEPISDIPAQYTKWFWDLVDKHGSDRSYVQSATLTLRYDIATRRPVASGASLMESPYDCDVRITDTRGKGILRALSRLVVSRAAYSAGNRPVSSVSITSRNPSGVEDLDLAAG